MKKVALAKRKQQKNILPAPITSMVKYENLKLVEKKAIDMLKDAFGMNEREALEVYFNPVKWQEFKNANQKLWEILDITQANQLFHQTAKKIGFGSLGQALKGVTSRAVIKDKTFGIKPHGSQFQINGQTLNVILGWHFKPYQANSIQKVRELEETIDVELSKNERTNIQSP